LEPIRSHDHGVELRILGPLEVRSGGRPVDLGGPKVRRLLAALVLDVGKVVSTDRLLEILWGPNPGERAATTLHSHVAHLRDALEPDRRGRPASGLVVTRDPGYLLAVDPEQVDAVRFERLTSEARRAMADGQPGDAMNLLSQALQLWRGDPLAEFSYEPFAHGEIVRLTELHLRAHEDRAEAGLALGHHGELAGELRRLVADHPLRERLWGYLILALYRGGRQAEALRACSELRHVLVEQLGLEPSPEIVRLENGVLLQSPELDWRPPPTDAPSKSDDEPVQLASTLPLQLTSFVGRTDEIAAALDTLSSTRLLTLTGTGGVGKTRLAVEIAGRSHLEHTLPVVFVELAPLADPALVPKRVASTLRLAEEPGVAIALSLVRHLADQDALLVLDNCEHLLPGLAGFTETLLRSCPRVRVLATSREPLRIPGETVWRVPSLVVPGPAGGQAVEAVVSSESAQLFLDRARAAGGPVRLSSDEADALVRICHQLEGIPLAIELAAAATAFLSLPEMADLLADRFRLLTGGAPNAPSRHQTLRAAVDWSYESLSQAEQTLFNRLSVFSGGFGLASAQEVCADDGVPADALVGLVGSLVDKSLVAADRSGFRTRYRILETLRQYGAERLALLDEHDAIRRHHLRWVASFVEECEPRLWGADAAAALDDLDREIDNIRVGLRRAHQEGPPEALLAVAGRLVKYWRLRGHHVEARDWLEVAVVASPRPTPARGKALLGLGSLALHQADYGAGGRWLTEALHTWEELGEEVGVAEALALLAAIEQMRGDFDAAERLSQRSLAAWRRSGVLRGLDISLDVLLHNMGELAYEQGDVDGAASRFEESIAVSRRLGVTVPLIHPLTGLGHIAGERGDFSTARALYEEGLEISRRFGYRRGEAGCLQYLAKLSLTENEVDAAGGMYREALEVWSSVGDKLGIVWCLEGLASVAVAAAELRRAAVLLGGATAIRAAISTPPAPSEQPGVDSAVRASSAGLDDTAFSTAWEQGRSSLPDVLVAWALRSDRAPEGPPRPVSRASSRPARREPAFPPPAG
jgi:predicted ATPase/DNA-binding SARP family transcriptional activator